MITQEQVAQAVYYCYKQAAIILPSDIKEGLEEAYEREDEDIAKLNIKSILENIRLARENSIPMCQDTGLPIIFVRYGKVDVEGLNEGIIEGVKRATGEVPLRTNVVDPLTRKNTGNNIGKGIPQINVELCDEEILEITVFPKGFGSENNNKLAMLLPGDGVEGIKKFFKEAIISAGGKPCPPTVIGVGIGGSSDMVMKLAKKALLKPINEVNEIAEYCALDMVQLHGHENIKYAEKIQKPIIKAYRYGEDFSLEGAEAYPAEYILIDSYSKATVGGSGISFKWREAASTIKQLKKPYIIAGGISAETIQKAIKIFLSVFIISPRLSYY